MIGGRGLDVRKDGVAREVVGYMIQRKLRPMELTYKRVVDSYCRAKRYEEAREFLAVVEETDPKSDQKLLGALAARVESAQFGRGDGDPGACS